MTVSPVRIRTRLVLVLAVPAIVLIAGMAAEVAARLQARSDAAVTARHATVALAVQDLVHALQRERALLMALLAGEPRVRADLAPARRGADRARSALAVLLAAVPSGWYVPVREALARLPALDRARAATPALPADPDTPAAPGGPPPRAPQAALAPTAPLMGPFGTPVSPGAAIASPVPSGAAGASPALPGATIPSPVPSGAAGASPALRGADIPSSATSGAAIPPAPPQAAAEPAAAPSLPPGVSRTTAPSDRLSPGAAPRSFAAKHRGTPVVRAAEGVAAIDLPGPAAASGVPHRYTSGRSAYARHQAAARVLTTTYACGPRGCDAARHHGAAASAATGTTHTRETNGRDTARHREAAASAATGTTHTRETNGAEAARHPGVGPAARFPAAFVVAGAGPSSGVPQEDVMGRAKVGVDRGPVVRQAVFEAFTDAIEGLADGVYAVEVGRSDPVLARRLRALEAVSRAKEAAARERAVVTAAFATGGFTQSEYVTFLEARASMANALAGYRRVATPAGAAELERVQRGAHATRTARLERRALAAPPGTPLTARTRSWLAASSAYVDALHLLQRSVGHELRARATAAGERHTRWLTWPAGLAVAGLLGAAALVVLMARSVVRPLRRLAGEATALADQVAVLEAGEATTLTGRGGILEPGGVIAPAGRSAGLEAGMTTTPTGRGVGLEAGAPTAPAGRLGGPPGGVIAPTGRGGVLEAGEVPVREVFPRTAADPDGEAAVRPAHFWRAYDASSPGEGRPEGPAARENPPYESGTEFGRLAGALGDLHEAAVRIAAGRAAVRRDAAASLSELGMRHRDLAHRQLAFIGALQRHESDPAVLARLCELDRLTSRLRRNAESLLVLTGRRGQRRSSEPVPVDEVLRSVLAEIEDHHRVALRVVGRAEVRGPVVAEVAHLLAELMENALGYSPPDAKVDVVSRADEGECRITISDYGAGMTAGELAAANARLRGEESYLVAPTRCLGHHVAGRLAERLGVRVSLHPSPGCGVTARVTLPEELLAVRSAELAEGVR